MQFMSRCKRILRFIPMIAVMIVIFIFSMMPADQSDQTSGTLLDIVLSFVRKLKSGDISAELAGSLHHFIRKGAHFTEYAVLGVTVMMAIWKEWKEEKWPLLLPIIISSFYATTDEIHQYFVPGRWGTWTDVIIDTAGAFTGIIIYYLISKKKTSR